jgi:hypothetical protein
MISAPKPPKKPSNPAAKNNDCHYCGKKASVFSLDKVVLTISNLISEKQNLITDLKQTEDFLSIEKLSLAMRSLLILTKACK